MQDPWFEDPWVGSLASSCMHFRTPHWTLDIQKMRQAQQEEEEADFLVVCFAHHGLGFIGFIESCALSCMPHRTMLRPMKGLATSRHWFVLAYVHYIALECPLGQASDGRSRGGSMEVSCPHAHPVQTCCLGSGRGGAAIRWGPGILVRCFFVRG